MEAKLIKLGELKSDRREMTDMMVLAGEDQKPFAYSTEMDMINRIVLGMSSSNFRKKLGLPRDAEIRFFFTIDQIDLFQRLHHANTGLLAIGLCYSERRDRLTELADRIGAVSKFKQIMAMAE
jgi:hypothetical protein